MSAPEGFPPFDLPAQEGVFAPDYAPEEIAEIARKLRIGRRPARRADRRRGQQRHGNGSVVDKVKDAVS